MATSLSTLDFFAGAVGGCSGLVIGHPFDTIKVKQHVTTEMHPSIVSIMRTTLAQEGVKGLFRGMAFPLVSTSGLQAVFFGSYGNALRLMGEDDNKKSNNYSKIFVAASLASVAQAIFWCPVELVKVRLQAQSSICPNTGKQLHGPWECSKKIFKDHGLRGGYRGMTAMLAREMPSCGIYLTSYEYLKDIWTPKGQRSCSLWVELMAGGTAGCISWAMNIPLDVIKSRMQADDLANPRYRGMVHCGVESFKEYGIKIFWRGLPAACLRAFPSNAVTLVVYSKLLSALQDLAQGPAIIE